MASKEPIPLQAGDTSTSPTLQQTTMVPFDDTAGLDMDMGFIIDLEERNELQEQNEQLEEEAGQLVLFGSSSSYGPAPLPPSRTTGYRSKYDVKPREDDISPFKPSVRSSPVGQVSPEKAQLRMTVGNLKRTLHVQNARTQG